MPTPQSKSYNLSREFMDRMYKAATELIKASPLACDLQKTPEDLGHSWSESNKTFIIHVEGNTPFGKMTYHFWFRDVDEVKGTFTLSPEILIAGRSGKAPAGKGIPNTKLFWGSLGFTIDV